MSATRYIDLTPLGVLRCMTGTNEDTEARLLRALLLRSASRAWRSDELAQLLPDTDGAARTLFQLQRAQYIEVQLDAPASGDTEWNGLQADLDAMVAQGASLAALVDVDGLVLAKAGSNTGGDDALLPPLEPCTRLQAGEGALAATYGLALQGLAADTSRPLVQLARRLATARAAR